MNWLSRNKKFRKRIVDIDTRTKGLRFIKHKKEKSR